MLNKLMYRNSWSIYVVRVIVIFFAALCFSIAINFFNVPGNIYSGGAIGIAQLTSYTLSHFTNLKHVPQTGTFYFLINVPLLLFALWKLGRSFTFWTILSVVTTSTMSNLFPIQGISEEPLLNAVIGGFFSGLAVGSLVKFGMSAGGTDVISMYISRKTGMNVGSITLAMNAIIIAWAGSIYKMEFALFTLISMYVTSRVVNSLYTNNQRLTALIVTDHTEQVSSAIYRRIRRGITILDGQGGFTKKPRKVLMVVLNRYEIYDLQDAVLQVDPHAFINVVQSVKVAGNYLNRQQQEKVHHNPIYE